MILLAFSSYRKWCGTSIQGTGSIHISVKPEWNYQLSPEAGPGLTIQLGGYWHDEIADNCDNISKSWYEILKYEVSKYLEGLISRTSSVN